MNIDAGNAVGIKPSKYINLNPGTELQINGEAGHSGTYWIECGEGLG